MKNSTNSPASLIPEALRNEGEGEVVNIDLNRPMNEILEELNKYPVSTRLSLKGTIIVGRDIAHAKIKERLDAGEPMPQYLKDHPIYYAGLPKSRRECRQDHSTHYCRTNGLLCRPVPGGRRLNGDDRQRQQKPTGD